MKDSKSALFFCLIVINVLAIQSLSKNDVQSNEDEQREINLKEFEETFGAQIRKLDPLFNETFECVRGKILKYKLDPFKFPIIPLKFKTAAIESDLLITGFQIHGLASFEFVNAFVNILPLHFKLAVKLDNIGVIFKKYKGSLRIMDMLHLYGDGSFAANFTNFNLNTKINLKYKSIIRPDKGILIKNIEFDMDLFKTKIDITGLFNDPFMSKLISKQLTKALTGIAEGEQERINTIIRNTATKLVEKQINPFLQTKNLFEILAMVNGAKLCVPSVEYINRGIDFIQNYVNTGADFNIKDYLSQVSDYYYYHLK